MSGNGQSFLEGSLISVLETWFAANVASIDGIHYPNKNYTPPVPSGPKGWLRCSFLPNETKQASVGDDGKNFMSGTMLVNVFWPKGKAAGDANAIADSIVTAFKRGVICPAVSGFSATIVKSWRGAALEEQYWFGIPVRTRWWAWVDNT